MVIFVQVKIKLFSNSIGFNSNLLSRHGVLQMMKQKVAFKSKTKMQFILLVTCIFILVSIEYLVSMKSISKTLRTRVIVQVLVSIVIPIIWMKNNKRFFEYLSKSILDVPVLPPHQMMWYDLKSIVNTNKVSPIDRGLFGTIGLPIVQIQPQFVVMNISQDLAMPVLPTEQDQDSVLPTSQQSSSHSGAGCIQTLPKNILNSSEDQTFPEVEC